MEPSEWYRRVGAIALADTMGQITPEEKEQASWLMAMTAPPEVAKSILDSIMGTTN